MRVAVLVKQVPDSWAVKRLDAGLRVNRDACDRVLNDLDEYAIEQALVWQESVGAEVVLVSMGPAVAEEALRRGLSMGADSAVLVSDAALAGADALITARVLAAAVAKVAPDVVLCGVATTDGGMGVVPSMVAQMLGWPGLTNVSSVSVSSAGARSSVVAARANESVQVELEAALPAVVSVAEKINTPRYPNFKGIMAAKKKTVDVWSLSDLGVSVGDSASSAAAVLAGVVDMPARSGGVVVTDAAGDSVSGLVAFLESRKVI